MTHEVKNNHDAPLGIAGVSIGAGKTVGIEADALRMALSSKTVQMWLKLELIEIEGLEELQGDQEPVQPTIPGIPGVTPPADNGGGDGDKSPERQELEAKAAELGVQGVIARMKDETLTAKIAEAEAAANGGGQ